MSHFGSLCGFVGCCGSLWVVVDHCVGHCGSLWVVAGHCGSLRVVAGRCGSLWVVAGCCGSFLTLACTPPVDGALAEMCNRSLFKN